MPDSVASDELGVMLANGVTTIRLMIGTPEHLALRREIEAGPDRAAAMDRKPAVHGPEGSELPCREDAGRSQGGGE